MSCSNSQPHVNSWIGYRCLSRTMIIGYKTTLRRPSETLSDDAPQAGWRAVLFPLSWWLCCSSLHTCLSNRSQIWMASTFPALSSALPSSLLAHHMGCCHSAGTSYTIDVQISWMHCTFVIASWRHRRAILLGAMFFNVICVLNTSRFYSPHTSILSRISLL